MRTVAAMSPTVSPEQRRAAKHQMMELQELGEQMRTVAAMSPTVSPEQRRAAKHQMMELIEQGASVQ
jgi:hypothetical protein